MAPWFSEDTSWYLHLQSSPWRHALFYPSFLIPLLSYSLRSLCHSISPLHFLLCSVELATTCHRPLIVPCTYSPLLSLSSRTPVLVWHGQPLLKIALVNGMDVSKVMCENYLVEILYFLIDSCGWDAGDSASITQMTTLCNWKAMRNMGSSWPHTAEPPWTTFSFLSFMWDRIQFPPYLSHCILSSA